MIKKYVLALSIMFSTISFAQDKIIEFKNTLKTSFLYAKEVIPIVNKENGEFSIFIADPKKVYAYKFNDAFQIIGRLASEEKRIIYRNFIGSSILDNGNNQVYLANRTKRKFMVVNFSYKESKSTINEFKLAKGEKFIQTVSLNNQFYLITVDKNKRELYFNTFNDSGEISKHKVDFSGCPIFINKFRMTTKVIDLLMRAKRIDRFEYNTPNSVEEVSDPSKIYVKDDNVIFTFDDNEKFTQVLVVNMNTFKASKKEFIKPLSHITDTRKKTNSFISGKYVFLVSSTKQLFSMRIVAYENGEKLKEFEVKQHENISFKNSPIIHEGSVYNSYRELKKTKQFLRKITAGQIGVSVLNQNDNFIVTIGGCPYCSTNPPTNGYVSFSPTTGAMTIPSVSTSSISNNTTSMAYNSFLHTNSTRIFCKFDKNFNHIEGEIKDNAFDKIKRDKKEYNIKEENETIFKYRDYYVQIHYEDSLKKYVLRKYTND